jgi:hypothetical protein
MMSNHLKEAVTYFKNGPYDKLLRALRIRFESNGQTVGTISTGALTDGELQALAAFLDMTEPALELRGRFSLGNFEEQLSEKFSEVTLQQFLSVYFEEAPEMEINKK